MPLTPAIVNPVKGPNPPNLGRVALIVASEADLVLILNQNKTIERHQGKLYMSRLFQVRTEKGVCSLVGPILGAPYAAMVAEALIVWGVEKILFLGWCGAVSPEVRTGDVVVPESALVDEGTSPSYTDRPDIPPLASQQMLAAIKAELRMRDHKFHSGPIWSTDAVFRETAEKVRHFRAKGALGVEMETAAIFSVARFRNAAAGALLVVSDELSSLTWKPGFKTPQFKTARQKICSLSLELCRDLVEA